MITTSVNVEELQVALQNLDEGVDTRGMAALCEAAAKLLQKELTWRESQCQALPIQAAEP